MKRKIFRILLFIFLVYLPIQFVADQFIVRNKLEKVVQKFNVEVDYYEKTDHFYASEFGEKNIFQFQKTIDSILIERNQVLKNEHFLKMGTWNYSFFRTDAIIYLNATWMPDDIYNLMAKMNGLSTPATFLENIFALFIFILPIVVYIFGWLSVKYFLRKPAH